MMKNMCVYGVAAALAATVAMVAAGAPTPIREGVLQTGLDGAGYAISNVVVYAVPAGATNWVRAATGGVVAVTGYTGPGGRVAVPAEFGGLPVTAIGQEAFALDTGVEEVVIPAGVTNIGANAFSGCTALTNITFLGDAPAFGATVFGESGMARLTVAVATAAGWGAAVQGVPVYRGPVAVSEWLYMHGGTADDGAWRIGYSATATGVVVQVRVDGTWTNAVQFLAP